MKNKDISLLSAFEYEQWYARPEFNDSQRHYYFDLTAEEKKLLDNKKQPHVKLNFILQLGYFKYKQRLFRFSLDEIEQDITYLSERYFSNKNIKFVLPARDTIKSNNEEILMLMGYTYSKQQSIELTTEKIAQLVPQLSCPKMIVHELLDYCRAKNIIVPAYTRLQKIIGGILAKEDRRLSNLIKKYITDDKKTLLQTLLTSDGKSKYQIYLLKTNPKNFTHKQLKRHMKLLEEYRVLYNHALIVVPKLGLSVQNLQYYASLVEYYNTNELTELVPEKSHLYLICYVHQRLRSIRDHLIEAFKHYIEKHQKNGKEYADKTLASRALEIVNDLPESSKLLRFYNDKSLYNTTFDDVCQKAHKILSKEKIEMVCNFLSRKQGHRDAHKWDFYVTKQKTIIKNLRPLFRSIDFDYGADASDLAEAAAFLKVQFDANKSLNKLPRIRFPINFIPTTLKPYVLSDGEVDVQKYEFLVYTQILLKLDAGIVFCDNSTEYRDFETEIRESANWDDKKHREALTQELDVKELSMPIEKLLSATKVEINALYEKINQDIVNGSNKDIKLQKMPEGHSWSLPYKKRKSEFNNPFYEKLPRIDISALLDFVDKKTGFLSEFTPLKSYGFKTPLDKSAINACVIANATSFGIFKMSEACNLSYNVLHRTTKSRVRCDNLHNASDKIIYKFSKLAIYEYYNVADELAWGSADGQKYKTTWDTFKSRPSQKYFHFGKGVVAYTSVMNNIALTTKIIGANQHESHQLQELVSGNTSGLDFDCIATDTEGSNKVNYVLLRGMKVDYTPCYKNLKQKTENLVGFKSKQYYSNDEKYIIKPKETVKEVLIQQEWDDVKPILAAVWAKEIPQSILVKKLCMHKRKSRVKEALYEYNNILRTRHILKYIGDDVYRGCIRHSLNRGEAYHLLRRKIAEAHGGEFRGGSDAEVAIWNECGRLIANAIIFYNAFMLSTLMEQKKAQGDWAAVEFIQKLSPIACQHINFSGLYEFKPGGESIDIEAMLELLDEILRAVVR